MRKRTVRCRGAVEEDERSVVEKSPMVGAGVIVKVDLARESL